jgi:MFS family permease
MVGLFMLILRDVPLPKGVVPSFQFGSFLRSFWISPRAYPDFAWAWFTRFLLVLSYVGISTYLLYYLQDVIHYSKLFPGKPAVAGFTVFQSYFFIALFIASLVLGYVSDRSQRRKGFVIAAGIIMALALFALAFFSSWTTVLVAAVVLGFGYGIYTAVDIALVIAVLPSARDRGKDMGIINIANTLPQVIAPLVGLLLVSSLHSYLLFYAFAGVTALLAALLIPRIKSIR